MQQKPSACTEIENVIAELLMFPWSASKLAAVYPQGRTQYSACLRTFLFIYLFICVAGLGTDCQQSDHGLCYRQRWTSIWVCCAPDGQERFL